MSDSDPHLIPSSREAAIRQLISGKDVETIVVYDVSDCQLYGRRHRECLTGELAKAAEEAGCEPVVYESVYWFTLAYIPIKPLGVYLVMPRRVCDDPDGDADQYRAIRLPDDWDQIRVHLVVGAGALCATLFAMLAFFFSRGGM